MASRAASVDLTVRLGDVVLPNPIVAASGTFGYGDEVARLCPPDRLGAVTVKSLAAFEWPGNPAPRAAGAGSRALGRARAAPAARARRACDRVGVGSYR